MVAVKSVAAKREPDRLTKKMMEGLLKILILEDSPDDLDLVERELKRGGIEFVSTVVKKK